MSCRVDLSDEYQELQCSSTNSNQKAYVCAPGYTFSPPTDRIIFDDVGTDGGLQTCPPPSNVCIQAPIPQIVRPHRQTSMECTISDKSSPFDQTRLDQLKECLMKNRLGGEEACYGDCSYERYKGDYLREIKDNNGTIIDSSFISNIEVREEQPLQYCIDPDEFNRMNVIDTDYINLAIPSNGTEYDATSETPCQDDYSVDITPVDYQLSGSHQSWLNSVEQGRSLPVDGDYNTYVGYELGNLRGTTSEILINKLTATQDQPQIIDENSQAPGQNFIGKVTTQCATGYHNNQNVELTIDTSGNSRLDGCLVNQCTTDSGGLRSVFTQSPGDIEEESCSSGGQIFNSCPGNQRPFQLFYDDDCEVSDTNELINLTQDYTRIDRCNSIQNKDNCDSHPVCFWNESNGRENSICQHQCGARQTKGECEQYVRWNSTTLSDKIYDFDGNDDMCRWIPIQGAIDESNNSIEGMCKPKMDDNVPFPKENEFVRTGSNSCEINVTDYVYPTEGVTINQSNINGNIVSIDGVDHCVPLNILHLGQPYCKYNTILSQELECSKRDADSCESEQCELFSVSEPGLDGSGVCVSDGVEVIDPETGERLGLIQSDSECRNYDEQQCSQGEGDGCIWQPYEYHCVGKIDLSEEYSDGQITNVLSSCNPIKAHVPDDYDFNMLEAEQIDVSTYRDRDNNEFPYNTSKYLCDVCSIRDKDIDTYNSLPEGHYKDNFILLRDRGTFSEQDYCERPIEVKNEQEITPCEWSSEDNKCRSICSTHTPEGDISSIDELNESREQCVNDKWYPKNSSFHATLFPNFNNQGEEYKDDYYNDRYCSWDGFECTNSIPCKYAQQIRCEDMGYNWYEGTATDVEDQQALLNSGGGLELDLSAEYPVLRKGDGKPVEGDMEGVCIYPNEGSQEFIGMPRGYEIRSEFRGEQGILLKWREYGSGWWEDSTLCSRLRSQDRDEFNISENDNKSYYLGENIIFIPFNIQAGDKPSDIKRAINSKLETYEYFVLNGEWIVFAQDILEWAIHNYTSAKPINEQDSDRYGYNYYKLESDGGSPNLNEQKMLNVIYDLRGMINLIPVVDGQPRLKIDVLDILSDTGNLTFEVTGDEHFEFVEIIGSEIFNDSPTSELNQNKLKLTVLSSYKYNDNIDRVENPNIASGYGTLYEPNYINGDLRAPTTEEFNARNVDNFVILDTVDEPGLSELNMAIESLTQSVDDGAQRELLNWALFNEYINFNTYSQPIISQKGELKRATIDNISNQKLCFGSFESWKVFNLRNPQKGNHKYQSVDLTNKCTGLLKLLARYSANPTNHNWSTIIENDYLTNYQPNQDDGSYIEKAMVWSMTRNTHRYWGNLYYTRGDLGTTDAVDTNSDNYKLYKYNSNFNKIPEDSQSPIWDSDTFNNGVGVDPTSTNTILLPFATTSPDPDGQPISWLKLMKYMGGNKQLVYLRKTVSYEDYSDYIRLMSPEEDGLTNNTYRSETNQELIDRFNDMKPIIALSKREYIIRSLLDELRREITVNSTRTWNNQYNNDPDDIEQNSDYVTVPIIIKGLSQVFNKPQNNYFLNGRSYTTTTGEKVTYPTDIDDINEDNRNLSYMSAGVVDGTILLDSSSYVLNKNAAEILHELTDPSDNNIETVIDNIIPKYQIIEPRTRDFNIRARYIDMLPRAYDETIPLNMERGALWDPTYGERIISDNIVMFNPHVHLAPVFYNHLDPTRGMEGVTANTYDRYWETRCVDSGDYTRTNDGGYQTCGMWLGDGRITYNGQSIVVAYASTNNWYGGDILYYNTTDKLSTPDGMMYDPPYIASNSGCNDIATAAPRTDDQWNDMDSEVLSGGDEVGNLNLSCNNLLLASNGYADEWGDASHSWFWSSGDSYKNWGQFGRRQTIDKTQYATHIGTETWPESVADIRANVQDWQGTGDIPYDEITFTPLPSEHILYNGITSDPHNINWYDWINGDSKYTTIDLGVMDEGGQRLLPMTPNGSNVIREGDGNFDVDYPPEYFPNKEKHTARMSEIMNDEYYNKSYSEKMDMWRDYLDPISYPPQISEDNLIDITNNRIQLANPTTNLGDTLTPMYTLTRIPSPSNLNPTTLDSWGKDGICEAPESTIFEGISEDELDDLDDLRTDGTLLPWCLTNKSLAEIDTSENISFGMSKINSPTDIDPFNYENNMGILYNQWVQQKPFDTPEPGSEYFGGDKEINAWKYPSICQPWRMIVPGSISRDPNSNKFNGTPIAPLMPVDILHWKKYDNTYVDTDNYLNYSADISLPTQLPTDYHKYNLPSTQWSVDSEEAWTINSDLNNIWLNSKTYDDYKSRPVEQIFNNAKLGELDGRYLHNMLHPMSITCARPPEKPVFIDITPNNTLTSSGYINNRFFEETVTQPLNNTSSISNSSNQLVNCDQYLDNIDNIGNIGNLDYWLHTGLASVQLGQKPIVYGTLKNKDTQTVQDMTDYIKYFYMTNRLFTDDIIQRDNTSYQSGVIMYKFNPDNYGTTTLGQYVYNARLNEIVTSLYSSRLPTSNSDVFIDATLFGGGESRRAGNTLQGIRQIQLPFIGGIFQISGSNLMLDTLDILSNSDNDISRPILQNNLTVIDPSEPPEVLTINNVNNVLNKFNGSQYDICKEVIRDRLFTCASSDEWENPNMGGCEGCFNRLGNGLCEAAFYNEIISGGDNVCSVLSQNITNNYPWIFIDVEIEPEGYGENIPESNPYQNNQCSDISQEGYNMSFTKLQKSKGASSSITFFKPVRDQVSDIFLTTSGVPNSYGCVRDDIQLTDKSFFEDTDGNQILSCNTNIATPVERDKHVMINYIIKHARDSNGGMLFNVSDRTKLAVMDTEELIQKALEVGISYEDLKNYTRPRVGTKTRDIKLGDIYENWNDLQQNYYNIGDEDKLELYQSSREWEFKGCGLDLNFDDGSSGNYACKDKYPGLCEYNRDKCDSPNTQVRNAIMLDCPETCNTQFTDLDDFENSSVGILSICTSRGRCRWSEDQDPSNLLPLCEETESRTPGNSDDCVNYLSVETGRCGSDNNTPECKQQKCLSMAGCKYTSPQIGGCRIENYTDDSITDAGVCNESGNIWNEAQSKCIIPEVFLTSIDNEIDCISQGGRFEQPISESCYFDPDFSPQEDPCHHSMRVEDLTNDERIQYTINSDSLPIQINGIEPEYVGDPPQALDGSDARLPEGFKLLLSGNNPFEIGDYIHIQGSTETGEFRDECHSLLMGNSMVIGIANDGVSPIIQGPNLAYTLPLRDNLSDEDIYGRYDIGNCQIDQHYRIDFTETQDSCLSNEYGNCTYIAEDSVDYDGIPCKSCGLLSTREECYENNLMSSCGFGEMRNICEAIESIEECNDLYMEGCQWNLDRQRCEINQLSDSDGSPVREPVSCVKCSDMKHQGFCNSIDNCYWNNSEANLNLMLENSAIPDVKKQEIQLAIDAGVGYCDTCGGIPDQTTCDDVTITEGNCEWRNTIHGGTGLEDGSGTTVGHCYPARKYPFILDWILWNWKYLMIMITVFSINWYIGTKMSILMYEANIIRYIILFIIVSLLIKYWGIQRNPNYLDPPILNSDDISFMSIFYEYNPEKRIEGAVWPAAFYRKEWDDLILDGIEYRESSSNEHECVVEKGGQYVNKTSSDGEVIVSNSKLLTSFTNTYTINSDGTDYTFNANENIILEFDDPNIFEYIYDYITNSNSGIVNQYSLIQTAQEGVASIAKGSDVNIYLYKETDSPESKIKLDDFTSYTYNEAHHVIEKECLIVEKTLSRIANLEIYPSALNWSAGPRYIIGNVNKVIDTIGGDDSFTIILMLFVVFFIIRNLQKTVNPLDTLMAFVVGLCIYFIVKYYVSKKQPTGQIEWNDKKSRYEYSGIEVKCPFRSDEPTPGIIRETLDDFLCGDNEDLQRNIDVCPYGCVHNNKSTDIIVPSQGDTSSDFPNKVPCKDNRSIFHLPYIIDPIIYKSNFADKYGSDKFFINPEFVSQIEGSITNPAESYTCPPKVQQSENPYELLCPNTEYKCVSTTSNHTSSKADDMCDLHFIINGTCAEGDTIDSTTHPLDTSINGENIACKLQAPSLDNDSCPFESPRYLTSRIEDNVDIRQPINIWEMIYDIDSGENIPTPQRLSWQNEERSYIVDQNYRKQGQTIFN